MKIALIGGAGARTPLLVRGLVASDLPIDEIALFDTDASRLELIAAVAAEVGGKVEVHPERDAAACVEGADFIFTAIRVGGIETRARDEKIALKYGQLGQETVGPVGFAKAARTVPPMIAYAELIAKVAPTAWVINFTNPVGIITQAIAPILGARAIGICDTPTELFAAAAHALGLPPHECSFDYFGLNHLGWLREVLHRGVPQLRTLWRDEERLRSIYRAPLFDAKFLADLRLLPTEYLYYYYRTADAVANLKSAKSTRGQAIATMNTKLLADLAGAASGRVDIYDRYLAERDGSYFQLESGAKEKIAPAPSAALTGYDKIALEVVRAIHFNRGEVIPLNVLNRGNLALLESDDVIEVPCIVDGNGVRALHVGPVPEAVRDLLVRVKRYERLTVAAATARSVEQARQALAENPLVADKALAEKLCDAFSPLW